MTEQEWLACSEPERMVETLRGKGSERKLRLAGVACCRRFVSTVQEEMAWSTVELAEQVADGLIPDAERAAAFENALHSADWPGYDQDRALASLAYILGDVDHIVQVPQMICRLEAFNIYIDPRVWVCSALRDVFPFRPVAFAPSWRTSTVLRLAQTAYDERHLPEGTLDVTRLAVLADALEEAGCDSAELLAHLRGPGPHVRGCWAVDLVLGKE